MSTVTITAADSNSVARICSKRGFNCFQFLADVSGRLVEVVDSAPGFEQGEGRPSGHGTPILFPFPNRIRGGEFQWQGRSYRLTSDRVSCDAAGNAIHGFVLDRAWRIVEQTDHSVTGEFQLSRDAPECVDLWPADFILRCRYDIQGARLTSRFEISNPDSVPLPWGLGTHTYFRLPLAESSRADRCLLVAPPQQHFHLVDCLPDGSFQALPADLPLSEGVYFGSRQLDDVFGGVPDNIVECVMMDEAAGLQVAQRNPGSFRYLVIYTPPDRNAVCFEPYTCLTDAVNLQQSGVDAGWQVLDPGASVSAWIDVEAGPVLA